MRSLIIIVLSIISLSSFSNKVDSLLNEIHLETNDSIKFKTYSLIIGEYINYNPSKAEEYSIKQQSIAVTKNEKATALLNLGLAFDYQYKFEEAINSYHNSLNIFQEIKDSVGIAKVLLNLGVVNYYKRDLDSSIFYYIKTLNVSEATNQDKMISSALGNLSTIHRDLEEYNTALKYGLRALKIEENLDNIDDVAGSLNNIAICYRGLKDYDKSLEYYNKAYDIRKSLNDERGLAIVLTNIGQLYFFKKNYSRALDFNLQALEFEMKLNNELGIAESYVNIGDCYFEMGSINNCIEYLEKSLLTSEKLGIAELQLVSLEGLSLAYSKLGDYKQAYISNARYASLQDSLFKETRMKKVKELESKYDAEHAEKENELLKRENTINHLQLEQKGVLERNLFIGITLLILIMVLIIYAYYSNKKSSKKLSIRNKRIELMNNDLSVKNKEITDSIHYAKRIQEAILPQDKIVKKYLEESFILYKPKDIVSGDFYWMENLGEKILIAAVDCTGHGVPGAFMSIVGNNGLNKAVLEQQNYRPALILDSLNDYVNKSVQKNETEIVDGMDIALCSIDLKNRKLFFSGAFNPLYLVRNNNLTVYNANKQPVGGASNKFNEIEIDLEYGDVFYIFTDGFADQFGGVNNKKFNKKRFKKTLLDLHKLPMDDQNKELERIFENWKGNEEQLDDICVIGFRI